METQRLSEKICFFYDQFLKSDRKLPENPKILKILNM